MKYYCNPVNINYRYQFNADPRKHGEMQICREAADPAMILFKGKYYIFDYNLSPDCEQATYLGYTMTTDRSKAITDLRVAPYVGVSASTDNIMLGDIKYSRIDILGTATTYGDEQSKPQADCLYFTKDKNAGEAVKELMMREKKSEIERPGW